MHVLTGKDYSEKKETEEKNVAYPTQSDSALHIFHCLICNQKTLICINSLFYADCSVYSASSISGMIL